MNYFFNDKWKKNRDAFWIRGRLKSKTFIILWLVGNKTFLLAKTKRKKKHNTLTYTCRGADRRRYDKADKRGGLGSAVGNLKLETCAGNYQTAAKPHQRNLMPQQIKE